MHSVHPPSLQHVTLYCVHHPSVYSVHCTVTRLVYTVTRRVYTVDSVQHVTLYSVHRVCTVYTRGHHTTESAFSKTAPLGLMEN